MQAIVTKYIGPTNTRGSRVKASCQAGSITISWDDSLNSEDNHDAACLALRKRLAKGDARSFWVAARWIGGAMPDGRGNAYVGTMRIPHD